ALPAVLQRGGLLGVQRREAGPLGRHVGLGEDGLDGALRHARLAVDAVGRVDVEHLLVLVEALDRANGNAIGVLAVVAGLANGVGHRNRVLSREWTHPASAPRGSGADGPRGRRGRGSTPHPGYP